MNVALRDLLRKRRDEDVFLPMQHILGSSSNIVSAFRDRGFPGPTSEMSPRAPA
jgi:hypothetical protein